MTEHKITSAILPTPRKAWIHRSTAGEAKDCLLLLDGELYTERVKAPDILREAEEAGALPPVTCVYLPNASAAGRKSAEDRIKRHGLRAHHSLFCVVRGLFLQGQGFSAFGA